MMLNKLKHASLVMWLFLIVSALALLFGLWSQHQVIPTQSAQPALASGFILPTPRPVAAFTLQNTQGNTWDNASLKGHFSMVFFGFTHCPQMCPTTLSALKQAYQQWQVDERMVTPQVVFVSVDPQRDNAKVVASYLSSFQKDFVGVIGDDNHLKPLLDSLGVLVMKPEHHTMHHDAMHGQAAHNNKAVNQVTKPHRGGVTDNDYNVDHSGSVMVIDPEGRLVAFLTPPHTSKTLAQDVKQLVMAYYHPDQKG
jgi:protein SCO1